MADEVDSANEMQDTMVNAALANRVIYEGESAEECEECGADIPQGRRLALPGIQICVLCAEKQDIRNGRHRVH